MPHNECGSECRCPKERHLGAERHYWGLCPRIDGFVTGLQVRISQRLHEDIGLRFEWLSRDRLCSDLMYVAREFAIMVQTIFGTANGLRIRHRRLPAAAPN